MSKKRTFKELLQLLPQKEQPEDKAEKEAAEPALQGNEAEDAAAAVQHENAYAKLGKAFINRLHLPNELIANAAEVESIVNRIISVWEKVEAKPLILPLKKMRRNPLKTLRMQMPNVCRFLSQAALRRHRKRIMKQ